MHIGKMIPVKKKLLKTSLYPLFYLKFEHNFDRNTIKRTKKAPTVMIHRGNFCQKKNVGKELDSETGLYYFGARYLDPKTGRWISGDPAVGEYIPVAPVNEEARKRNGSLPGMGGVFNYVNLHVYHYGGNNPVKYRDPDGEAIVISATRNSTFYKSATVALNTGIGNQIVNKYGNREDSRNFRILLSIYQYPLSGERGLTTVFNYPGTEEIRSINVQINPRLNFHESVLVIAHELGHVSLIDDPREYNGIEGEIAAFSAQFSTAAELYATALPLLANYWKDALYSTLPVELREAFYAFDITKRFDEQGRNFYIALRAGTEAYKQHEIN